MTLEERAKKLGGSNVVTMLTPDGTEIVSCTIKGQSTAVLDNDSLHTEYSLRAGAYPEVYIFVDKNCVVINKEVVDHIPKLKGAKGALYYSCVMYSSFIGSGMSHAEAKGHIVEHLMSTNLWVNTTRARSAASKLYRGIKRCGKDVTWMTPLELFSISYTTGTYIKTGGSGAGSGRVKSKKMKTTTNDIVEASLSTPDVKRTTSDSLLVNIASGDTPFFVCGLNTITKYEGAEGVIVNKNGVFILHYDGEVNIDDVVFTVDEAVKAAGLDV